VKWQKSAEEALARVPFFVRKRVKKKVEEEATSLGALEVDLQHVKSCRQKFLKNMENEIQGFQVEQCFGSNGCPNRAMTNDGLAQEIEKILVGKNFKEFLKKTVAGSLKMHHQFRISISDCPNACSRPQIVDIGMIGCRRPIVGEEPCSQCGACAEVCKERAVVLTAPGEFPILTNDKCVGCGQCIDLCPTGTIRELRSGYRLLLGGKLGRHPQLGGELSGVYSAEEVFSVINQCVDHYFKHNLCGERFGEILNRQPLQIGIDKFHHKKHEEYEGV